jgi:hypothetical protein
MPSSSSSEQFFESENLNDDRLFRQFLLHYQSNQLNLFFRQNGFRFYFYSQEGNGPAHFYVQYGDKTAKCWLSPENLASNFRLKANELRKASVIIEENQQTFKEKWNEYFGRK